MSKSIILIFFLLWVGLASALAQNHEEAVVPRTEQSVVWEETTLFTDWKEAWKERKRVFRLDLSNQEQIPAKLGKLKKLRELILKDNQLTELPKGLEQLILLEMLDLSGNQLGALPLEIPVLPELRELNLAKNALKTVPESISRLPKLQKLNLTDNQIEQVPLFLDSLPEGKLELRLLGNPIKDLILNEADLAAAPLFTSLEEALKNPLMVYKLQLSNIKELPKEISQLPNLQNLTLNNNGLTKLPTEIGDLKKLQELNLINNQLQTLPDEVAMLKNLKTLRTCWEI